MNTFLTPVTIYPCNLFSISTQIFNDLLTQEVKHRYSTLPRHKEFWKLLVKEGLTLVSQDEDAMSTVSLVQAQEFLKDEVVDMVIMLPTFSL